MAFSLTKFIKGISIKQENTTTPNAIDIIPGGSSNTTTTITSSQTANRTITFADASYTVTGTDTAQTLTNKTIDADLNTISNIDDNEIKAAAGINATKIGAGTVDNTELGYLDGVTSSIQTQLNNKQDSATAVTLTGTQTLTNKTIDADLNTISNIDNNDIKASAAIDATKIGNGDVDNTELSYVNGVTSSIQTQLNNKEPSFSVLPINKGGTGQSTQTDAFDALAPTTTKGDIIVHNGTDNVRLAIGADETTPVADSTTATGIKWAPVQAGLKNYILNSGAEANLNGWVAYADAAGSMPVNGTGGSPTVTITRSTSSPLRGTASFLLTKDAANRQGEGVSYDFTIDSADTAKILKISMDYSIISGTYSGGTSSTDSDITCYIYDITNSQVIQPASFKLNNGLNGEKYQLNATFQSNTNSTSYRLIFHVATTSASAYTMKFDNVYVTPQFVSTGSMVSDWINFIPTTQGLGTITTTQAQYRRVGGDIELKYQIITGTVSGSEARIGIPSGLLSDSTVPTIMSCGIWTRDTVSTAHGGTMLVEPSVGYLTFTVQDIFGSGSVSGSAKAIGNVQFNSTETLYITAKIPISGFGTSQVLSSETDTRVVAASYETAAATATGAGTAYGFQDKVYDTHNAYNTSTGLYTVPVAGKYHIDARVYTSALQYLNIYVNGVNKAQGTEGTTATCATISADYDLKAGDTIAVYTTNSGTTAAGAFVTNFQIHRIAGPSQIAANETVALRYTDSTGQSISSGVHIQFTTKDYDTHGAWATDTFTAPVSGLYKIRSSIAFGDYAGGTRFPLAIEKNGTTVKTNISYPNTAASQSCDVSATIKLLAGDTIKINNDENATGSPALIASDIYNDIEIIRVGN